MAQDWQEQREREKAEAKAKIPEWIEKGSKYIYPERMEAWEKHVKKQAEGIFLGAGLDKTIELMERLENGESFEELTEIITSDKTREYMGAVLGVLRFSKLGPEFAEYFERKIGQYDRYRGIIEEQKRENDRIKKSHEEGPTKKSFSELPYEERKQAAKERIPEWVEKGSKFIYPERMEAWKKHVKNQAEGIFLGTGLDKTIELMERLENGESFEELTEIITSDKTREYMGAVLGVLRFSKLGPEFAEYFEKKIGQYDRYREMIEEQKKENDRIKKLHEGESAEKVSDERRREEKEIKELSEKKGQLESEIGDVERELDGLSKQEKEQEADEKEESDSQEPKDETRDE